METLIADGFFAGSLDLTTTELADYVCGGVFDAGPERGLAASRAGMPAVLAPGCVDMANLGGIETVPERYHDRLLYQWNPNVTLLRTNVEENRRIGEMLAAAANAATGTGRRAAAARRRIDARQPRAATSGTRRRTRPASPRSGRTLGRDIPVEELDLNINDPEFADRAADLGLVE